MNMRHPGVIKMEARIKQILEKRPILTFFPVIHDGDTKKSSGTREIKSDDNPNY